MFKFLLIYFCLKYSEIECYFWAITTPPAILAIVIVLLIHMEKKDKQNHGVPSVYYFIYFYVFFCQGMYSNSLGALIPYLSEAEHTPETDFSFLFMARTLGSLAGILLFKYIHSKEHHKLEHKVLVGSGIVYVVFMVLFVQWGGRLGQWVSMNLTGGAYYTTITAANICILLIVADKKGVQIVMGYAFFGVGALLSPQLIGIFE